MGANNYGFYATCLHEELPITMISMHFVQWKDCSSYNNTHARSKNGFFVDLNVPLDKQTRDEDFEVEGDFDLKYEKGHNIAVMFVCKDERKMATVHFFINCLAQLRQVNVEQENIELIIFQIVQENLQAFVYHVTILPPPNVYQELLNDRTPVALAFAKCIVYGNPNGNHIACMITTKSNTSNGSQQTKYETKEATFNGRQTNVIDPFQLLTDAGVPFKLQKSDFTTINFESNPAYNQESASTSIPIRPELYSLMEESEDDKDHGPIFQVENFRVDKIRTNAGKCQREGCKRILHKKLAFPIRVMCRGKWYHLTCFAEIRKQLDWLRNGSELPNFSELSEDQQAMVAKLLPEISA